MPHIRIPVVCPQCQSETLAALPVATVAASLLDGSPMELEQIREYMSVPEISAPTIEDEPHA